MWHDGNGHENGGIIMKQGDKIYESYGSIYGKKITEYTIVSMDDDFIDVINMLGDISSIRPSRINTMYQYQPGIYLGYDMDIQSADLRANACMTQVLREIGEKEATVRKEKAAALTLLHNPPVIQGVNYNGI